MSQWRSVLSLHLEELRDQTYIIRLGSKHYTLLRHLVPCLASVISGCNNNIVTEIENIKDSQVNPSILPCVTYQRCVDQSSTGLEVPRSPIVTLQHSEVMVLGHGYGLWEAIAFIPGAEPQVGKTHTQERQM